MWKFLGKYVHVETADTFVLGVGWQEREYYGNGGLEIYIGKRVVCFW